MANVETASAAEASVIELDESTLRLEEEKGYVLEGSVCEMEISSSERAHPHDRERPP